MDQNINQQNTGAGNVNNQNEDVITFNDSAVAQAVRDKAEKVMNRAWIGFILAAAVTVFWIMFKVCPPAIFQESDTVMAIAALTAVVAAIVSYILGGGFKTALKTAFKIAKFGWRILPFPADLITGFICFVIALIIFIAFPIIFVAIGYRDKKKEYEAAVLYLSGYNKAG